MLIYIIIIQKCGILVVVKHFLLQAIKKIFGMPNILNVPLKV